MSMWNLVLIFSFQSWNVNEEHEKHQLRIQLSFEKFTQIYIGAGNQHHLLAPYGFEPNHGKSDRKAQNFLFCQPIKAAVHVQLTNENSLIFYLECFKEKIKYYYCQMSSPFLQNIR